MRGCQRNLPRWAHTLRRDPIFWNVRDLDIIVRELAGPIPTDLLSSDERDRASRFHFSRDRDHFIACRSILRIILSEYLKISPPMIEFSYSAHGKPATHGLHFNVSHSDGLAAFAVSRTREVGIDIERINPEIVAGQIAEQFFSPGEVFALRALPEDRQVNAFFRCWTRKEAYAKACGLGLTLSLAEFEVNLDDPAKFLRGGKGWEIESFLPAPGYIGAVVARSS